MDKIQKGKYDSKGLTELGEIPDDVTTLSCRGNRLTKLPKLPSKLEYLACNGNQLTSLPDLPTTLIAMNVGYNRITALPELPEGLEALHCISNKLKALPKLHNNIGELTCDSNQLTILKELPDSIFSLSCSNNLLTTITNIPKNCAIMSIDTNYLTVLPALPPSLSELSCANNVLVELPELPETLEKLYCDYNVLKRLPTLPNALKRLWCHGNNITEYPEFTPNLEVIFIDCEKLDVSRLSETNLDFLIAYIYRNKDADFTQDNMWGPHNFTRPLVIKMLERKKLIQWMQSPPIDVEFATEPVILNGSEMVNDVIEGEQPLVDYIRDDTNDNIVFYYSGIFYPTKRSILSQTLHLNENNNEFVYFCDNNEGRIRLSRNQPTIETLYLRFRSIGIILDYISIEYVKFVIKDNATFYVINDTGETTPSVVSYNVYHHPQKVGYVSAAHCQEGQGGNVFKLQKLNVTFEIPGTPEPERPESKRSIEMADVSTPEPANKRPRTEGGRKFTRKGRRGVTRKRRTRRS